MKGMWMKLLVLCAALALMSAAGCRKGAEVEVEQPVAEESQPAEMETAEVPEIDEAAVAAARKLGTVSEAEAVTTASGLGYIVVKAGEGQEAKAGDAVQVHYTGWLVNGSKFDSSVDRGQPFEFPVGAGRVIRGWDEGVAGMKVGEVRKLIVPPDLGYGSRGVGPIPPGSTLIFEVELLKVGG